MAYLNFSWILEGSLAGAQGPTNTRDITFFKLNDIQAVVRMEENTISTEPWQMVELYEPVRDFTAPDLEQIHRIVTFVEEEMETWERPVVVTCAAGPGTHRHHPGLLLRESRVPTPGRHQLRPPTAARLHPDPGAGRGSPPVRRLPERGIARPATVPQREW